MLDSDNKISPGTPLKVEVSGDYYHALDYEKLQVSYAELTKEDNLVWVELGND